VPPRPAEREERLVHRPIEHLVGEDAGRVQVPPLLRLLDVDRPPHPVDRDDGPQPLPHGARPDRVPLVERRLLLGIEVAVDRQPALAPAHLADQLEPAERIPLVDQLVVVEPAQPVKLPRAREVAAALVAA
jgi:hypothetical protein